MTLPALLMRADTANEPRPFIVHTNGYDSTVCEMLLGNALAASRADTIVSSSTGRGKPGH